MMLYVRLHPSRSSPGQVVQSIQSTSPHTVVIRTARRAVTITLRSNVTRHPFVLGQHSVSVTEVTLSTT